MKISTKKLVMEDGWISIDPQNNFGFTYKSHFFFTHLNHYHFMFRLTSKTSVILMWILHILPWTNFNAWGGCLKLDRHGKSQKGACTVCLLPYHFASPSSQIWGNTVQTSSELLKPTTTISQNQQFNFCVSKNKKKRHCTGSSVLWLFKSSDRKSS